MILFDLKLHQKTGTRNVVTTTSSLLDIAADENGRHADFKSVAGDVLKHFLMSN